VAVDVFVHWLYTQNLPKGADEWIRVLGLEESTKDDDLWWQEAFLVCLKAYVFGDRFLLPTFRQAVNNFFVRVLTDTCFLKPYRWLAISYAFANVPADRLILQLLVDECCNEWHEGIDTEEDFVAQRKLPAQFLLRVMRRSNEMRHDINTSTRCYEEHGSEQEKARCRCVHMMYDEDADYGYFK
jgi:hypothetical protein